MSNHVKSYSIKIDLINGLESRPSPNPWWNQKTSKGLKGKYGKCVLACHKSTLLCPVKPCSPAMLIVRQSLETSNHYLRNQHRSNSWTSFPPCLPSISAEIVKQTSENNTACMLRTITSVTLRSYRLSHILPIIHCEQLSIISDYGKLGGIRPRLPFLQGAKPRLARVNVTFKRRGSPTKPTLPVALARTVLTMITSSTASRWSGAAGYCKSTKCDLESVRLTKDNWLTTMWEIWIRDTVGRIISIYYP